MCQTFWIQIVKRSYSKTPIYALYAIYACIYPAVGILTFELDKFHAQLSMKKGFIIVSPVQICIKYIEVIVISVEYPQSLC